MSVYTSIYAMDSRVKAPELGDFGYIGSPPVNSDGDPHDYLRVYNGLSLAGLTTLELDRFRAFLESHGNERLYFFVEGADDDFSRELDAILDEYDSRGEELPVFEMAGSENYKLARYRISCDGAEYLAQNLEHFREVAPLSVDKKDLANLINDVFRDDWEVDFYRIGGLVDPYDGDLANIRDFIVGNPGPFEIEYLTGEAAERPPPTPVAAETAAGTSAAQPDTGVSSEESAPRRGKWIKLRDTIILLFFIWIAIRIIYHLLK